MAARLSAAFAAARARGVPAFVAYLTAGFPRLADTVPALLAMQAAGVDVVELGVPFSDPMADGGTIQASNMVALANGISLRGVLAIVKEARAAGVTLREDCARAARASGVRERGSERACMPIERGRGSRMAPPFLVPSSHTSHIPPSRATLARPPARLHARPQLSF